MHPSKQNLLSHKVLPITPNLLFKIFDYGALTPEIEKKYITSIFNQLNKKRGSSANTNTGEEKMGRRYVELICDFVFEGQAAMKDFFRSQSAVSLRDVNRVKQVFEFYVYFLEYETICKSNSCNSTFDQFKESFEFNLGQLPVKKILIVLSVTMHMNYIFRLGLKGSRFIF